MKCSKVRRTLPAFLDDEVTPAQRAVIEVHLKYCPLCRSEVAALKGTDRLLDAVRDVEPRRALVPAVVAQIRRERAEREAYAGAAGWFRRYRYALVATAANVLIVFSLLWHEARPPVPSLQSEMTHATPPGPVVLDAFLNPLDQIAAFNETGPVNAEPAEMRALTNMVLSNAVYRQAEPLVSAQPTWSGSARPRRIVIHDFSLDQRRGRLILIEVSEQRTR